MTRVKCKLIDLPKVNEGKGNLTYLEASKEVPFQIKRVYYLYDIPNAEMRGGHAHKKLNQFLIAINGSLDVTVDDGQGNKETFHMNRPYEALYIPPMFWRELANFSSGGVCLVLASDIYDPNDYIRIYEEFKSAAK